VLFEITVNKKLIAHIYVTHTTGCLQLREFWRVVLRNPTSNNQEESNQKT